MHARLLCWLLLSLAITASAQSNFLSRMENIAQETGRDAARFHDLLNAEWEYRLKEFPEWATEIGAPGEHAEWTDLSPVAIQRRQAATRALGRAMETISRGRLDENDQLSFDLFLHENRKDIEGQQFPGELLQLTQLNGIHRDVPQVFEIMPRQSVSDYRAILKRLSALPVLVDQTIALLKRGVASNITPAQITLRNVPGLVSHLLTPTPGNPLLMPFANFPEGVGAGDRTRLLQEATNLLVRSVVPAMGRLHAYLTNAYVPSARTNIAWSTAPNGVAWYAYNVRQITTTDLTPAAIHAIGQAEVKRIRAAMQDVMRTTGFKGEFPAFLEHLRTAPEFFYTDAESLLRGYRDIAKRIDGELPRLFGRLPRLPYGVVAIPGYSEQSQTAAYYMPGSMEAGRAGNFYANTYNLAARPRWEMEALTLHEAMPGHHLQIALAQEQQGVPDFRKHVHYTAFVEGWGLYAESLGGALGLYQDPYSRFGQLTFEMWRAIRLVIDTGMHSLGWTREEAIAFFKANAARAEHDIVVEVDRYIVWPGQALAYKLGELKIKDLRAEAESKLGERFDVRKFHDCVLGQGALPLSLLEKRVRSWVEKESAALKTVTR